MRIIFLDLSFWEWKKNSRPEFLGGLMARGLARLYRDSVNWDISERNLQNELGSSKGQNFRYFQKSDVLLFLFSFETLDIELL